ncbi:hypothetical protein H0H81_008427 [Sphagnurus paluster]|uniref:Amidase domain-containing protein n=1 Tax=Sphagnurus paluster TaxID=117069 RepID=A0A9P7K498_9AGAR|nr:hypothetical protein H0H81_008427 [Sphagnurus paluster]
MCGTYGFRPSTGRVPYAGSVNSLEGQDSLPSVLGPLSNSIFGIKAFMQGVLSQRTWLRDPLVIRKHWDEEEYKLVEHGRGQSLCFAIIWDDGEVVPHPPIVRGLEETKRALEKAGHKVIDWKPLNHSMIMSVGQSIFDAGFAADFRAVSASSGEHLVKTMLPSQIPDPDGAFANERETISAYDLWQLQKAKRDLRQAYLEYWLATASETGTGRPVDALISPVAPFAAPPHGKYNYTMVFNALDYPALVIPVCKVDPDVDVKKPAHAFLNKKDQSTYELYEPEIYRDAPIAIQVVGRTQEDEAVIAMAEIVDAALKLRDN